VPAQRRDDVADGGRLAPELKTIVDFLRYNGTAIRNVSRRSVELCVGLKLLSSDKLAIADSKFEAVNSRDINYTTGKSTSASSRLRKPFSDITA
jgi:transposase